MKKLVGDRLPEISPELAKLLAGSLDFVGVNHYTTVYARNDRMRIRKFLLQDASSDSAVITTSSREGKAIGEKAASSWLHIVPWGIRKLAVYLKDHYGNPPIFITENGMTDTAFKSRSKARLYKMYVLDQSNPAHLDQIVSTSIYVFSWLMRQYMM
ncbi:hypothetical protein Dimus_012576 [Dionaea muscipula]